MFIELDATLWALIALILFLVLVVYMGVPKMLTDALDSRANEIRSRLDDARRAREEANKLLADYKARRLEAEAEASEIVSAAKREADVMVEEAERRIKEYVERRTLLAEQKISQAEANALSEVRSAAVERAIELARKQIEEGMDEGMLDEIFVRSLDEAKVHLKN